MLTYPILTTRSLATLSRASNDKIPSKYFGLIKLFPYQKFRVPVGSTLFGMTVCPYKVPTLSRILNSSTNFLSQ